MLARPQPHRAMALVSALSCLYNIREGVEALGGSPCIEGVYLGEHVGEDRAVDQAGGSIVASITVAFGTEATMQPIAKFAAVESAADVTPLE